MHRALHPLRTPLSRRGVHHTPFLMSRLVHQTTRQLARVEPPHKTYFQDDLPPPNFSRPPPEEPRQPLSSKYRFKWIFSIFLFVLSYQYTKGFIKFSLPHYFVDKDPKLNDQLMKFVSDRANESKMLEQIREAKHEDGTLVWKQVGYDHEVGNGQSPDPPTEETVTAEDGQVDIIEPPVRRGLLGKTLRKAGMVSLNWSWYNEREREGLSLVRIESALSGWPAITHGGLLATLLDEAMGRTAISLFPAKTGVTANLTLEYMKPCLTREFVLIKTQVVETTEKKAKVQGTIFNTEGVPLCKGKSVYSYV